VATAAAQLLAATAQARERGTVTPLPFGIVVATTTPEAPVVASTPTPGNAATARANSVDATAVAITTGTFTPVPRGARTPTPGPTATPLPLIVAITPRPTPSPTPTPPGQAPRQLAGKILFRSDREGVERFYALDPATGRLYWITQAWPFEVAQSAEGRGSDGRRAEVQTVTEITSTDPYTGAWSGSRSTAAIFVLDDRYKTQKQITTMDRFSYDPAWSPGGEWIAFVSTEGGNDEIFLIRPDGSDLRRLTTNTWEWDKHPTWSPDGSQIVFWSNRESGRRQLWIMNADGSNPRELLESPYNDWDPIWVK
jgi:TolB protein